MRGRGFFGRTFDFNRDGRLSPLERMMDIAMYDMMSKESRLSDAGLDRNELRHMDKYERREVLRNAGLDPYDYDDFDF